jgi:NADPH:quinone reductase-like Zn-dependent oxidoreductase
MQAIVYHRFGLPDVLELQEIDRPIPGDDEVLIGVRAASVNPLDWGLMRGEPAFLRFLAGRDKPHRPGRDVAGVVEAAGRNVTQFKAGDAVFGACRGSFAEYACARASALAVKPAQVTFEQAAAIPVAGLTALQGLRDKGRLQPGQSVLINGASGGVGTFAIQIARAFGASVTGICSTRNLEMIRSLGADQAIDYTREDFTARPERYDLLLDCIGNHSLTACKRVLKPQGRCVLVGGPKEFGGMLRRIVEALVLPRVVMFIARLNSTDLMLLAELVATGKVTPVIDRLYGLSEAREAVRYAAAGHARGKVVVTLERSMPT